MIKTKDTEKTIIDEEVISYVCNKCETEYLVNDPNNTFEFQEFLNINFIGGYGSVFGDERLVKANIFQYCLYDFIGDCYDN